MCTALKSALAEQDAAVGTDVLDNLLEGQHVCLVDWPVPTLAFHDPGQIQAVRRAFDEHIYLVNSTSADH
jgi:hypothetical protein